MMKLCCFWMLFTVTASPLFCNVNTRAEFLEIHRRIIFTEALIDIARRVNHSKIPQELNSKLNSLLTRARSSETKLLQPIRLSEKEIKKFKELMSVNSIDPAGKNAWEIFCETQIKGKLGIVWQHVENEIGVNFLSLRKEDVDQHIDQPPQWESVLRSSLNDVYLGYEVDLNLKDIERYRETFTYWDNVKPTIIFWLVRNTWMADKIINAGLEFRYGLQNGNDLLSRVCFVLADDFKEKIWEANVINGKYKGHTIRKLTANLLQTLGNNQIGLFLISVYLHKAYRPAIGVSEAFVRQNSKRRIRRPNGK